MPRTRLPDEVKKKQGTSRKCRISRTITASGTLDPQLPPTGLTQDAKDAWRMALENSKPGQIGVLDAALLERWCRAWAGYRRLAAEVTHDGYTIETPTGRTVLHPSFVAMQALSGEMLKMEKELGFTPVARARVPVTPDAGPSNPFIE